MSRMLKALRQLESTQRLVAPVVDSPARADDVAEESAVAVAETAVAKSPPPIVPVTTIELSTEDTFEPAFTSWKELAEPYDVDQSLTFGDFLGDSDAKVQTREVTDAIAPPPTPIAIATAEIVQELPVELTTDVSTPVAIPDEPAIDNVLTPEPPALVEMELEIEESDEAVIDRVSDALDLTDDLTTSVAQEVADDVVAEQSITAAANIENTIAEELVAEVPLETPELSNSGIDDVLVEPVVESPDVDQPVSEPLAVVEDVDAAVEQANDSVVEELAPESVIDEPVIDDAVPTSEVIDETNVEETEVEQEELTAPDEVPDLPDTFNDFIVDEIEDPLPLEMEASITSELSEEGESAHSDEPLTDVTPEPTTPDMDDVATEAAELDKLSDVGEAEVDTPLPVIDEQLEAGAGVAADVESPSDDNELNWGDLFPGGELDGELSESGEQDVDALVESLGHFDVDELVANAPTQTLEDQLDETPASELPVETEEDVATSGHLKLPDETPVSTAAPETEYVAPAPNDENRPELSPAETAALTDLSNDVLLKQYNSLADRIRSDLVTGEYRCAAFVGAEHQPHVTETILRTAIAVGLGKAQHVLMVDASLNDKHLTAGLNQMVELGLTEVLKGRAPWQQVVRATATPGVCMLPAGRLSPPKEDEIEDSLTLLLKELTSQWDLVLLDAGNCQEPAAKCIMAAARNVYLLARLGETETEAAAAAVATIAESGATNRGCVVTNASIV